jgi:hypothetical protein
VLGNTQIHRDYAADLATLVPYCAWNLSFRSMIAQTI